MRRLLALLPQIKVCATAGKLNGGDNKFPGGPYGPYPSLKKTRRAVQVHGLIAVQEGVVKNVPPLLLICPGKYDVRDFSIFCHRIQGDSLLVSYLVIPLRGGFCLAVRSLAGLAG